MISRRRHWLASLLILLAVAVQFPTASAAADDDSCSFYIAESSTRPGRLGVYSAKTHSHGSTVATSSESLWMLSIADANKNEWSPWHDYITTYSARQFEALLLTESPLLLEHQYRTDILTTGVASFMACSFQFANVEAPWKKLADGAGVVVEDSVNVTRRDATAGSFSYHVLADHHQQRHGGLIATTDIWAGEELVLPCEPDVDDATVVTATKRKVMDRTYLAHSGVCLSNNLSIQPSTIEKGGRGAFAKNSFSAGQVIESSPVLHLDRSQVELVHQDYYSTTNSTMFETRNAHSIHYQNSRVIGHQLWMNYCLSSDDSNVLLLPLQPAVSMLNHGSSSSRRLQQQQANARLQWSTKVAAKVDKLKSLRPMELFSNKFAQEELLVLDVVAIREIKAGEEVMIDYGDNWAKAFAAHVDGYANKIASVDRHLLDYQDRGVFADQHAQDLIRTTDEQVNTPYPSNLQTACYFEHLVSDEEEEEYTSDGSVVWTDDHHGCLRPCDVLERTMDRKRGTATYKALVYELDNLATPTACKLSDATTRVEAIQVVHMPATAITVINKQYASDTFVDHAFRHTVGVPTGLYPDAWAAKDPSPSGDFMVPSYLAPGAMEHIRWKDTGTVVTPNAYILGISERVRLGLLDYCNRTGIIDILRHVTVEGNGLEPDDDMFLTVNKEQWYLQRPGKNWFSDLHWLSPAGHPAHEDYLQALGASGFDEMLQGVGEHLKMDGLVAFHVTFIAVSQAIRGYVHYDVTRTQAKTYNIIIPLTLADNTGPELDLQQWPPNADNLTPIGRLKYRYGMAAMMGDDAYHATSSVDYRPNKEMRLAATIYVADVNEVNVDRIQDQYTQAFPPRDSKLLMSWAGRHWRPNDPSRKLPVPVKDHVLIQSEEVLSTRPSLRRVKVFPDDESDSQPAATDDEVDEEDEEL